MSYSVPVAKVVCDSISVYGNRLITVEAKMHRFVLAELNTHRVFSRNSASSRAIPIGKMIEMVASDPAMPMWWGKNQPGMSAREEVGDIGAAREAWLKARDSAVAQAVNLNDIGLHKQLVNRILEPFMWHKVIITATEWENFFAQRRHPDAMPEMKAAADAIYEAIHGSSPLEVMRGYHLPYIGESDRLQVLEEKLDVTNTLKKISVARCARVSYLTHDGRRDIMEDIKLFDKLTSQVPLHASPLEHVARPSSSPREKTANFVGWVQYRRQYEISPVSH